jgi:hypothetical protein
VFARGLLRLGHPVYPVNRDTDVAAVQAAVPDPQFVLVAVGEANLAPALARLSEGWRDRLVLLQNELLPDDFAGFEQPTVISVWFEKKPGQDAKVIIPSPAYGPHASTLQAALGRLDIPVRILNDAGQLAFELVVKNLYILTSNIAGLRTGGTVSELWERHQDLARAVAGDVGDIQEALTGRQFDRAALLAAMLEAFAGDPDHKCMGRSAPARLQRALAHADAHQLAVPTLREIAAQALAAD